MAKGGAVMGLKLVRFIAGFILECVMLFMVYVGVEVSPLILALPFGLMGYDAPDLIRQIGGKK